jgi:hypothetical protein
MQRTIGGLAFPASSPKYANVETSGHDRSDESLQNPFFKTGKSLHHWKAVGLLDKYFLYWFT